MTNAFSLIRSLIIYGVCLPLAIFIGYLLATPLDMTTFTSVGLLFCLLTIPLFLRWHYPWLILSWNATAGLFFLPGKPSLMMLLTFVSFGISGLSYVMNRNLKFISVPSITRPLLFVLAVVLVTGKLTGSLGLNILGSDTMGGKRYLYVVAAVLGYFALVAHRIPPEKVKLYVKLFFLGTLSAAVGNLFMVISPSFNFIFLIFPADFGGAATSAAGGMNVSISRFTGVAAASSSLIGLMLAFNGMRGLLDFRSYWRSAVFGLLVIGCMYGGFRSKVIELLLLCGVLFYLEGLVRSRLLPIMLLILVLGGAFLVPFAGHLPLSVQRSLTFIPGLDLDKDAILNAKVSSEWRLEMWSTVIPQVPHYLILGKGLGIDARDMEMLEGGLDANAGTAAAAAMAGDYHNGPLSIIMPFGLLGVIGFLWLLVAGGKLLYRNYKFCDPEYVYINRFLFASFLVRVILFFTVFGSFYSDLAFFIGPVGLSIALNGGVRFPVRAPVVERQVVNKFKFASAVR